MDDFKRHTPGPLAWQKFGKDWCLTGQYGHRPIVLAVRKGALTSLCDGLLVPFDHEHPDARLIAAAPTLLQQRDELLTALESIAKSNAPDNDAEQLDREMRRICNVAREAIAKVRGEKGEK